MSNTWFVIVNPTSGNGASKMKWPLIFKELTTQNIIFNFEITKHKNHAIEIVKTAIKKGYTHFICVGGDGTLHTIVNGILSVNPSNLNDIILGIIPIGTGNDWVKTYNIPLDFKKAIKIIKEQYTVNQDFGKIDIINTAKTVYFNNLAGIGFDGYVVNKVHKFKNLGFLAYLVGAIVSITSYKKPTLKIEFNNSKIQQKTLMLLIGLCKYSGGGMQLTKDPNPTDGLFDISIIYKINLITILKNITNLFNGKICNHKLVHNHKTNILKVEVLDKNKAYIQADGELIGTGDFSISILQNSLNFIVPK
jgi:diacylglycerol kinase (ATP)